MQDMRKYNLDTHEVWVPHDYQKRSVQFILANPGAALFLDPGLGKTSIVLSALKILRPERSLVIAPLRVMYSVWPGEAAKWTNFREMTVRVLHGSTKNAEVRKPADVYVINPEGLPWLLTAMERYKVRFNNLVIDESTKFKNVDTQRFRFLRQILHTFGRRWILTGTPTSNSLLGLYGQMYIVDKGASLGPFYGAYKARYFRDTGGGMKPRRNALKEITDKVAPVSLRLSSEELQNLPKTITSDIIVELPQKARELYDRMEQDLAADLFSGGKITAVSAGALQMKCRQLANGAIYTEPKMPGVPRPWEEVHKAKLEAVEDLVDEIGGEGVLIAYEFAHDLARLKKMFGKDTPHVGAKADPKNMKAIEDAWNSGKIPILLGQTAAMSHGLNLQTGGNHIIWFAATSNFENYIQFIRRIARQGSTHEKVFIYRVIAKDTTDEVLVKSLKARGEVQGKFFSGLKEYLLRRAESYGK